MIELGAEVEMRFFVPGVPDEDAEAAWELMREACGALVDTRPTYSITYDDGTEIVATVGKQGIIAIIFGGKVFYIFEALGNPRSVPVDAVTVKEFFDEE